MAMTWNATMATGVPSVDSQHQELFRQINLLHDATIGGKGREEVGKILNFVGGCAMKHFAEEEWRMEQCNCPVADANKAAHVQFAATFTALRKTFDEKDAGPAVVLEIQQTLNDWLVNHILGIDVQLRHSLSTLPTGVGALQPA